jgi:hypothetical protein
VVASRQGRQGRQEARRAAVQAQAVAMAAGRVRERGLRENGLRVVMTLTRRDEVVAECDALVGRLLVTMTQDGLSLAEALAWCGDQVSPSEAARLRRAAMATQKDGPGDSADGDGPGDSADGDGPGGSADGDGRADETSTAQPGMAQPVMVPPARDKPVPAERAGLG